MGRYRGTTIAADTFLVSRRCLTPFTGFAGFVDYEHFLIIRGRLNDLGAVGYLADAWILADASMFWAPGVPRGR